MTGNHTKDMQELQEEFLEILGNSQQVMSELLKSQQETIAKSFDPLNTFGSFVEGAKQLATNPTKIMEANLDLWQQHMRLWHNATLRMMGQEPEPVAKPEKGDRRFSSEEWDNNQLFDFIRQSYLITSQWLVKTMSNIDGLSEQDAHKIEFHTKQMADALSPTNFLVTNPDVIKETVESKGENLVKGMQNLQRDLEAGDGQLKIMMTDPDAFELGKNVATTPGKIVFQNDIVQLIQYEPMTEHVYERPLLIFPPWINKYYILDLQPKNSFIRWALEKGYTVFVASWVNPDSTLSEKTFTDYLQEGVIESVDAIEKATGVSEVSVIGYCIGGTLTAAALAYMAEKGDDRIKAATFFAAQVDFSEAGDLKVFIDEQQLQNLDEMMAEKGYLDGDAMYTTFNMLRSNDLIWSFYVNNYLLGKDPIQFDLLYWNGDATRMPRTLHMFYLRECYLHNNLAKPGGMVLDGVPIDLTKINIPIYLQSSKEDHIAPYNSVFKAKKLYSGPVRFMMAGSGHIAGVINHPDANKYQYWINESQPNDLDEWIAGAVEHPGSWWPDWDNWLSQHSGPKVAARVPGDGKLKVLEEAPGSFAKTRN